MKHNIASWHTITKVLIVSILASGCSDKESKTAPPKSDVESSVRASIPTFLNLSDFDIEPISTGLETTKVNFKATVTPKEDLFLVDSVLEGVPHVAILKKVQVIGAEAMLYGSVSATRTMDNWKLSTPEITDGIGQFGRPRGSFDARALVEGSKEATAELRARNQQREAEERERQKGIREMDEARQAMQNERLQEEQNKKKRLTDASAVGRKYQGFLIYDEMRQRLQITFTEQKGFLVRVEARNPDNKTDVQTFSGELILNPIPDRNSRDDKTYSIILSPDAPKERSGERWEFYQREGVLKLNPTKEGLEGEADMGYKYQIRLQQDK